MCQSWVFGLIFAFPSEGLCPIKKGSPKKGSQSEEKSGKYQRRIMKGGWRGLDNTEGR